MKDIDGVIQFPYLRIVGPTEREREQMASGFSYGVGFWGTGLVFGLVFVAIGSLLMRAVEAL